jgi:hypothetical protein
MSQHLFLRAYMAGVVPPTVLSLAVYLFIMLGHNLFATPLPPVERIMIFPIVAGPNLWGIWNGVRAVMRHRLPLAAHGALLPVVNFAIGYPLARAFDIAIPPEMQRNAPMGFAMSIVIYYLVWKFGVGFLNTLVDVD